MKKVRHSNRLKKLSAAQDDLKGIILEMNNQRNVILGSSLLTMSDKDIRRLLKLVREDPSVDSRGTNVPGDPKSTEDLMPLAEAEKLAYPNVVSAFLDHAELGIGRTTGVLVMCAHSAEDLRREILSEWGEYFAQGVLVRIWRGMPEGFKLFHPHPVDALLRRHKILTPTFKFASTLHFNLA